MSQQAVLAVIDALEGLSIPYMVVGCLASSAHGIACASQNAGFVLELGATPISSIAARLGEQFGLNPQMSFETITATTRFELRHMGSAFKIELFLLSDDPHDRERFLRRRQGSVMGRTVWLPTPEDVIITKLKWSQLGKRTKDVDDVRNVIAVQGERIDWAYVNAWCDRHGTRTLLEQIRQSLQGLWGEQRQA